MTDLLTGPQLLQPGRRFYGVDIGVLVTDVTLPRPVGDVGNARTFDFPVLYHAVEGAPPDRVVEEDPRALLEPFLCGAAKLVAYGVAGIVTTCGFLASIQPELAAGVTVPIMTSSLMQIPAALRSIGPGRRLAVVTANGRTLGESHFLGAGVTPAERERLTLIGLEDCELLYPHLMNRSPGPLDVAAVGEEVTRRCVRVAREDPTVAGFVLECANLPPYAASVRAATGLPVWDAVSMTVQLWQAVRRPC
ncbi:hypothetical protein [Nonomuraea rhizosphaerae]|uniref:hypothetical protein n=1 Tax=Nonomuraea rhizosphaerae TaxID=2665663 RepID=UPI001C5F4520|nr:hypothetical protein [Nonomuraea rhizosphaerae]